MIRPAMANALKTECHRMKNAAGHKGFLLKMTCTAVPSTDKDDDDDADAKSLFRRRDDGGLGPNPAQ
jgi:hypothetical protein